MAASGARKAWNDAMKETARAALPSSALQGRKRRSDRHKKQDRRTKACKVFHTAHDDDDEYRIALWVDALEGIDPVAVAVADDDDDYDELESLDDEHEGKKKTRPRKRKGKELTKPGLLPKKFLPRSLGTILVEDPNRSAYLAAEARLPPGQQLPRRKFCPVTGIEGLYTEPKSGIPYSSLKALEQIRERPPPWMTLSGTATYYEAVKSIEDV